MRSEDSVASTCYYTEQQIHHVLQLPCTPFLEIQWTRPAPKPAGPDLGHCAKNGGSVDFIHPRVLGSPTRTGRTQVETNALISNLFLYWFIPVLICILYKMHVEMLMTYSSSYRNFKIWQWETKFSDLKFIQVRYIFVPQYQVTSERLRIVPDYRMTDIW